jgi:hypothetical protein
LLLHNVFPIFFISLRISAFRVLKVDDKNLGQIHFPRHEGEKVEMRGKLNKLIAIATVTCGTISSFLQITHQHIRIGTKLLPSPPPPPPPLPLPLPLFVTVYLQYSVGQREREKAFGGKGETRVLGDINS